MANIIYEKNEILITDIELNDYLELRSVENKNDYSNKYLKELIIIKKTINNIRKNYPDIISNFDSAIKLQMSEDDYNNSTKKNYFIYLNFRNEFISEYFLNEFDVDELKIIFDSIQEINLPISKNECLTINNVINLKNNEFFINNFYENIKINSKIFKVELNNKIYDVCINNETYDNLINLVINYIENKTQDTFNKFIYQK